MSCPFTDPSGYDRATGRFSRQVAGQFVPWLGVRRDARWLDCGCGTGAVTAAIIDLSWAGSVAAIDSSPAFLEQARRTLPGVRFELGDLTRMPFGDAEFDAVVAGAVLHHLPDRAAGAAEMIRVTAPGGTVGAFDWDPRADLNRLYWEAAGRAGAAGQEPSRLFESAEELAALLAGAGTGGVQTARFEAVVEYGSFDEWWNSILGRRGSVYEHFVAQPAAAQQRVRDEALALTGAAPRITAAAWAVKGRR